MENSGLDDLIPIMLGIEAEFIGLAMDLAGDTRLITVYNTYTHITQAALIDQHYNGTYTYLSDPYLSKWFGNCDKQGAKAVLEVYLTAAMDCCPERKDKIERCFEHLKNWK